LVRAADSGAALRRLRQALEDRELWRQEYSQRLVAIPGDLGEPRYGLSEADFRALGAGVDAVYHCGAWVNFTYPYQMLRAANVQGTVEAMRLACRGRAKPLHFVSSIAATPEGDFGFRDEPLVFEDEDSDSLLGLFGGYGETKWVAERLARIARSRGLPIAIYRPGVLSGHSRTGIGNVRDMVWSLIKSSIQMRSYPTTGHHLDVTPVDYVARAIVHLSLQPTSLDRLFQLPHPSPPPFREVYRILQTYGYPMEELSWQDWVGQLYEVAKVDKDNALAAFAGVAENLEVFGEQARAAGHEGALKEIFFDGANTRRGLEGSGIVCPPLDATLLATYLDYFVRAGFFPPPGGAPEGRVPQLEDVVHLSH
jgi:thioester reductase-like protein